MRSQTTQARRPPGRAPDLTEGMDVITVNLLKLELCDDGHMRLCRHSRVFPLFMAGAAQRWLFYWARRYGERMTWLTLDAGDVDPFPLIDPTLGAQRLTRSDDR